MADYELMDETNGIRYKYCWWRITVLVCVYLSITILVFLIWHRAYDSYDQTVNYLAFTNNVSIQLVEKATAYSAAFQNHGELSHDFRLVKPSTFRIKSLHSESDYDSFEEIDMRAPAPTKKLIVCYYSLPNADNNLNNLRLSNVNGSLCTHINVGMTYVQNFSIVIAEELQDVLENEVPKFRVQYPQSKLLLWVGGGGSSSLGFANMIKTHKTRKIFIQSLKHILRTYQLNGCDLDWEFPSAYNRERQHFSQLLYEIRAEYVREKRPYLLSVAVAAPEGIAYFAYDVGEINKYANHVNIMTYDYHFYTKSTPFTGLNAPLYARHNEHSILGTLNINYSVNWWLLNGLERSKLIVGLPTYGHSYTLVNPFNTAIGAPAKDIGRSGVTGFVAYSEICWFKQNNLHIVEIYDQQTCSPYITCGTEWISFENSLSIRCKAQYIKDNQLGGAMLFSLNTDDFSGICNEYGAKYYPLTEVVADVLQK
uniref:GH18 domain-containing protein n=1 Tax=Glossina brevipalpis TaxID=37001 RepID=A0A1A9WA71_9MUSC